MKRFLCALLTLVLVLALVPAAASAVELKDYKDVTHFQQAGTGGFVSIYQYENGTVTVGLDGKVSQSSVSGIKVGDSITKVTGPSGTFIAAHLHEYEWTVARDGHYYKCTCGQKHNWVPHIDPSEAVDGRCICGYKFMDNADLTVLWLKGIRLSPSFKKGTTEYEGKLIYKDLEETKISAFPFDAKATVELPKDLTLKKGTNVFEIKITAEDGVTTNTYKVTVEKE